MEYNDFPENMDNQTVEKLSQAYGEEEKVRMLSKDFQNLNIQAKMDEIGQLFGRVVMLITDLQKADIKHYELLQNHLNITHKQLAALEPYVHSVAVPNQRRYKSFHALCSAYCLCELDLINSICCLCATDVEYIYKRYFFDVMTVRIDALKSIMATYT